MNKRVNQNGILLGHCDYCAREGRLRNLARIEFDDHNINHYCPRCLPIVIDNVKKIHWIQEKGYKIEYPWKGGEGK